MISKDSIIKILNNRSFNTIFLDRDGVINVRIIDDYVMRVEDFEFLPGVMDAMKKLAERFENIIVVTNQQGIGKGLMTEAQLSEIHDFMKLKIEEAGGRIDAIYYCADLSGSGSKRRKPEIGMALEAMADFATIKFEKSIMVGDSMSDMHFGRNIGATTILTEEIEITDTETIDFQTNGLINLVNLIN